MRVCVCVCVRVCACVCVYVCMCVRGIHMDMQLFDKPKMICVKLTNVFGTRMVMIKSLCVCLFVFVRMLLNLVNVSFRCRNGCNEEGGTFRDYAH